MCCEKVFISEIRFVFFFSFGIIESFHVLPSDRDLFDPHFFWFLSPSLSLFFFFCTLNEEQGYSEVNTNKNFN